MIDIQLFQESIPFSNKRLSEPASQNGTYFNPVIMPFAINTTLGSNVFETVFYIKNNNAQKYYENVIISLMKEDPNRDAVPSSCSFEIDASNQASPGKLSINGYSNIPVSSAYDYPNGTSTTKSLDYLYNYVPIYNDSKIEVKFSYGYDELSSVNWDSLNSLLVIPSIGNESTPRMDYIPIRMRIKLFETPEKFTIRDYFIDISYTDEWKIGG